MGRPSAVLAAVVAVALVAAATVWAVGLGNDPALVVDARSIGGPCDDAREPPDVSAATPWCTLDRAVRAAPPGATVLVLGGRHPRLVLDGVERPGPVRLVADRADRPQLAGMDLRAINDVRIEGFRITDISRVEESTRIAIVGNDVSPHGFILGGGSGLRFEGNDVHDLRIAKAPPGSTEPRCNAFGPAAGIAPRCGHGLRVAAGTGLVVRGNRFRRIPADGIQVSGGERLVIEDNRFDRIAPTIDPAEHSDAIQFLGGSRSVTVRRNVFMHARGIIAIPDDGRIKGTTTGLVIENNVFAGPGNFAVSLYDTEGLRFVNNTAWGTSGGVILREHPAAPYRMRDVRLVNNVIDRLEAAPVMFAARHHNLIAAGRRAGPREIGGRPRFGRGWALAPRSPGDGAGSARDAPAADLDGRARPRSGRIDLGAVQTP